MYKKSSINQASLERVSVALEMVKEGMPMFGPNYTRVIDSFKSYWNTYGGWRTLLSSVYFHIAITVSVFTWPFWTVENWWNQPLSILPNLVGFTLGGYAMLMAFGDDSFRRTLLGSGKDGEPSPFMGMNSTFVHFLVTQIFAILVALIANSRPSKIIPGQVLDFLMRTVPIFPGLRMAAGYAFWWVGYVVFLYAITLTIAATFGIFKVAGWYDKSNPESSNDT